MLVAEDPVQAVAATHFGCLDDNLFDPRRFLAAGATTQPACPYYGALIDTAHTTRSCRDWRPRPDDALPHEYADAVESIRAQGFVGRSTLDGGRGGKGRGVWLADEPVPFEIDAGGDPVPTVVLTVEIPDDIVARYEVVESYPDEDWRPWREYLVPAKIVNSYLRLGHEQGAPNVPTAEKPA
jgi:hypothetical protein